MSWEKLKDNSGLAHIIAQLSNHALCNNGTP